MNISEKLVKCIGFIWDKANAGKNWIKHNVSPSECEQMFFNIPLIAADDIKHSKGRRKDTMPWGKLIKIGCFLLFSQLGKII